MEKAKDIYSKIIKEKCLDRVTDCFWAVLGKKKMRYELVGKNDTDNVNTNDIECHKMEDEKDLQAFPTSFKEKDSSPSKEKKEETLVSTKNPKESEKKAMTYFSMNEEELEREKEKNREGEKEIFGDIPKPEPKEEILEEDPQNTGWGDEDFDEELDIDI
ncbi:unnamed protein product [Moneuplotes crassus]|uniref:Uncharacterized protein n=1 Tax=Euplotes crassus TaxID=5936 RepID=A0AAD1XZ55_EUPCR|nr:unnamed protein product [Moneuplotes crassus]